MTKSSPKRNLEPLPLDRGWAWVICLSVFLVAFLAISGAQVNAIGFLDMVIELETTVTTMAMSITVQLFASSFFALISVNLFVPHFGQRPVVAIGAFVTALSSIGMSQSPSVTVFIIFSLIKGAAGGCYVVPCIALVSHYFKKRRSIATAISICGSCVAAIGPPRLIRVYVDEYGIRNTYLLLGAFELHMIALAMLLRPVSSYGPPLPDEPEINGTDVIEEEPEINGTDVIQEEPEINDTDVIKEEESDMELKLLESETNVKNPQIDALRKLRSVSFDMADDDQSPSETTRKNNESEALLYENVEEKKDMTSSCDDHRGPLTKSERPEYSRSNSGTSNRTLAKTGRRPPPLERGQSVWSMLSGAQGSLAGPATALEGQIIEEDEQKEHYCSKFKNILDLTLFREWRFRALILSDLLASSNTYLFAYFPTLLVIQGATKDQAATLQTIMGSVDLVARLTVGFIADMDKVNPSQVSATGILCLAIMCHMCPFFTTYEAMIGMSVGLGMFIGIRQSLSPVVHTEIMGIARMSKSFSFSILMIASGAAAHSAFLSAILESTGSTHIVWHYVGSVLIVYGIVIFCLPLIHKLEMKYKRKNSTGEKSLSQNA